MTGVDRFAVDVVVLEGQPMLLRGVDLETAALELVARGVPFAVIAERCRTSPSSVGRAVDAARKRAARRAGAAS